MPIIKIRRGTRAEWLASNTIPSQGEPCFESDTNSLKIGDGIHLYVDLSYITVPQNQRDALNAASNPSTSNKFIVSSDIQEFFEIVDHIDVEIYDPVGIRIDRTSSDPTVERIDKYGNPFDASPAFFDKHVIWGGRVRCVIDYNNSANIIYGSNARGDGLILDGSAGDVMVRCPNVKYKYEVDGNFQYFWVAPFDSNHSGFSYHPNCFQGASGSLGTPDAPQSTYFTGAFEAAGGLFEDTFKLISASGKQPVTGGVEYPGAPSTNFNIYNAFYWSRNKGAGWGITNMWAWALEQLLMYIEFGTRDIQGALGKGVADLGGGGFAGKFTGADSIGQLLDKNGTGAGSGTDGYTPVCWRGKENPYGNIWEFVSGINFLDGGIYRLIPPAGGSVDPWLSEGNYEEHTGLPAAEGYISTIKTDENSALAFIPEAASASENTFFCDYWAPAASDNIPRKGGMWMEGFKLGPACTLAINQHTYAYRDGGARLEFRPPLL